MKKQPRIIHFLTYYPHYSGDVLTGYATITEQQFRDILTLCGKKPTWKGAKYKQKPKSYTDRAQNTVEIGDMWEKVTDALEEQNWEEVEKRDPKTGKYKKVKRHPTLWGFSELGNFEPEELKKALRKGRAWAGNWEEGSFALGTDYEITKKKLDKWEKEHGEPEGPAWYF